MLRFLSDEGARAIIQMHIYQIFSANAWRSPSVLVLTLSPLLLTLYGVELSTPLSGELLSDRYVIRVICSLSLT